MSSSLGLTVVLYSFAVAAVCTLTAATGRRRPSVVPVALVVLEVAAALQALLDGVALASHRNGAEVTTNLGYLVTSLAVLPVTASVVRMDEGRWGSVALAVGCVLLAVVSVRLHQTLGTAHA